MFPRRRSMTLAAALAALAIAPEAVAAPAADGPGALSHFDLARKDCVGTARTERSKVWFTVADGVLSDVYFPTIDNTNVETLQYVVTDGATFTDLQTRDTTYTARALDDRALTCRVTTTADSGRYRIVTDYTTDPSRATVLVRSRLQALRGRLSDYRLYVRHDPTLNGNGGGDDGKKDPDNGGADDGDVATARGHRVLVGRDLETRTNAVNRDYAVPVHSALDVTGGFAQVTNGFAGRASDGLTQLDATHALTDVHESAAHGNVVQVARVPLGRDGRFTLALGYGDTQAGAIGAAQRSLRGGFGRVARDYARGWHRYDRRLREPRRPRGVSGRAWSDRLHAWFLQANVAKASEDKTFPGAFAAGLASPWGQAVSAGDPNNTYFGSYRETFARDLYETFTALMADGDRASARDAVRFLFERQQLPDGSMPRNSLPNGKLAPDSFNTQLDECAYPIVMALAAGITDAGTYRDHIRPAAYFVASHGPSFGPERWEEQSGFSPSTIAAEIAGLLAAADIADRHRDVASAAIFRGTADEFQRSIKRWTVTTNGPLEPRPYFIRLSKNGDPNADTVYNVGNGGPDLDQRRVIDAGFLELVRLGMFPAADDDVVRSLEVVDATIRRSTDRGDGFFRYNGDGYGDGLADGHPWAPTDKGNGHLWPLLAGERGEYELDTGDVTAALRRVDAMRSMTSGVGLIPEQAWEAPNLARSPFGTDPTIASIGFVNGRPAGSASPLTWSASQYVRLLADIGAARVTERPANTVRRYVRNRQGRTQLTLTSPPDASQAVDSVTVAGTSVPGNRVFLAANNTDTSFVTTTFQAIAAGDGSFSFAVPVSAGTTVLTAVAVAPDGATAMAQRRVVSDVAPGPLLFAADDPDGDDHGPGNFAYPTAPDFHAGAFDLERFEVFDVPDSGNVVFRVRTRDLTPTFGSPLGAQLVDVYVHRPGTSPTSTAAAFAQRNYRISEAGAWDRLIEVQGFGQRFVDATGAALATVQIRANDISRLITFTVPKAALGGTPASGWGFTVVLTSQDGFSDDLARGFQPTPQPFQLGVCAAAGTDPHCTVAPSTVPKAMDVLTPTGVAQSDELDYLLHNPVTIAPVTIP
jgi:glucan 1,4-alpha-glucosidase